MWRIAFTMSRDARRAISASRHCCAGRASPSGSSQKDEALIPQPCVLCSPHAEDLSAAALPTKGRTRTRS